MSTIEQRLNFYVANEFGINNLDLVEMNAVTLVVVVRKCAQKSYQDLKRRVPYRCSTTKLKDLEKAEQKSFSNMKQKFIETIEQSIVDSLVCNGKLNCSELNPYSIIKNVKKISEDKEFNGLFYQPFTFGLAQKWVNMTIKYLWILGGFDDEYEELIEVPIDSFVISKMKSLEIDVSTVWSEWDCPEEYLQVQNTLKEVLKDQGRTRISWENEAWVDERLSR